MPLSNEHVSIAPRTRAGGQSDFTTKVQPHTVHDIGLSLGYDKKPTAQGYRVEVLAQRCHLVLPSQRCHRTVDGEGKPSAIDNVCQ